MPTFAIPFGNYAEIAQLVEHNLAKVGVASSCLVFRSKTTKQAVFGQPLILKQNTQTLTLIPKIT